jgi:hypothetical protein
MEDYRGMYLVKDPGGDIIGKGYTLEAAWDRAKGNVDYGQTSIEYVSIDGHTLGYEQLQLFEDTSFIEK